MSPYRLTVVDSETLEHVRSYDFERGIRPYVITHDERTMYAQLSEFHGVVKFNLDKGRIVRQRKLPIDEGVTEDDYDFEAPHHGLAMTPDEKTLCAAGRASDYVALVSTRRLRPQAIIEVDDAPGWAAISPRGSALLRREHARRHAVGDLDPAPPGDPAARDGRRAEADRGRAAPARRDLHAAADPGLHGEAAGA